MKTRLSRLLLTAVIVCLSADVVLAGVFPGLFSFRNGVLSSVFLWPFQLVGC